MAAFQFAVNRILMNYGEDVNMSEMRKRYTLTQYYVNGVLLGSNSIWDSYIILSVAFIWEKNCGLTNNIIH